MRIHTGRVPATATWYRAAEGKTSTRPPILLLHGGPGSTHNYFELLDCLCETGRAVISYDQLGCGESFLEGRPELWKMETWVEELKAVREHLGLERLHILGQSFGGMLLLEYLLERPAGVCSAILSSTLPSARLWAREQHRMIRLLSPEDQRAIARAESTGDFASPAFRGANARYMARHCASDPDENSPECLRRPARTGEEAYLTAWGPSEYTPLGTLRDFDVTDRLGEIREPALVISGTDDLCTPLIAKTMADRLPNARWALMEGCRHMCFAEDREGYRTLLEDWLAEHDGVV